MGDPILHGADPKYSFFVWQGPQQQIPYATQSFTVKFYILIFDLDIYIYYTHIYTYINLSVPSLHILVGPGDLGFPTDPNQPVCFQGGGAYGNAWQLVTGRRVDTWSWVSWVSLLGIRGSFLEVSFLLRGFRHCSDIVSLDSIDMAITIKQKHDLRVSLVLNNLDMFLLIVVSWALQDNLILHYLTTFLVDSPFHDYCTSRIDRHTRSRRLRLMA